MNNINKILLYSSNTWYFAEGMFGPLFAVFANRIGGDILDITWAWALFLVVTGVLAIIVGRVSDHKYNKVDIMIAGYALNAVCTFMYLFVDKPWHLFLIQIGLGVAAAIATPTWDALYGEYNKKDGSGTIWGMADGTAKVVTGIAIICGGLVVNYLSFTWLFGIMSVLQSISVIHVWRIRKLFPKELKG